MIFDSNSYYIKIGKDVKHAGMPTLNGQLVKKFKYLGLF
jgi:hypothetical protein